MHGAGSVGRASDVRPLTLSLRSVDFSNFS